jgi:hypothetical protein
LPENSLKHFFLMRISTKQLLSRLLCLLVFLAYGGQARAQVANSHKTQNQQIKQGETPAGIDAQGWASIQKQMEMSKYKAYPQTDGGYASANIAHGWQIDYSSKGNTTLAPRDCEQGNYRISIRLESIGYTTLAPLNTPKALKTEDLGTTKGSKVSYEWDDNITEWWVNNEKGLEQWFYLKEALQGRTANTPLHLRMALQTDMQASQQGNRLTLQKGNTTLHYDKLKVWDATGKEIQAIMIYSPLRAEAIGSKKLGK